MEYMNKKIILDGDFETVMEIDNHYFLCNKKDRMCVLPFTLSSKGLLDKMGVIEDINYIEDIKVLTLLNDYITSDDKTDLVAANRILFDIIGSNVIDADKWMYLGTLYNNMSSDSLIKVYCVDISDVTVKNKNDVDDIKERKNFKIIDSSKVIQTDDMLLLASYLRLWNYFYVKSIKK